MTCHVLHAGDGYTYLTNSVATEDMDRSAHVPLVDYYTAHGTPPGRWVGSGCADLGLAAASPGEQVCMTEEHMLALFGEGLHPEANRLIAAATAAGKSYPQALREVQLGRRFYQFTEPAIPLVGALRAAYAGFERTKGRRPTVDERRDIKTSVATGLLAARDGVAPEPAAVRRYLVDELGKARQPVAGFDLVFSPVKSVSVLWALGGPQVREVVERVHEAAWRAAIAYGEREAGYTRTGAGGIAQIDTHGFVATAFDHRDSRAGDPDLHTHVAVANRVRGADGQWRTLHSQQVHRVAVSMSEVYNAHVEQGLTEQLGASWVEVSHGAGKRAVRELDGMPTELISGFSRRRSQVEAGYDQLVAGYVARYGHTPSRSVQMRLAQQATLADRPAKQEHRSLAEQVRGEQRHPGVRVLAPRPQQPAGAPHPVPGVIRGGSPVEQGVGGRSGECPDEVGVGVVPAQQRHAPGDHPGATAACALRLDALSGGQLPRCPARHRSILVRNLGSRHQPRANDPQPRHVATTSATAAANLYRTPPSSPEKDN